MRRPDMLARLLLLALLLLPPAALSVVVPADARAVPLSAHLAWLPVAGVPDIGTAVAAADRFEATPRDGNLGRRPGAWWFRVAVDNPADHPRDMLLHLPFDALSRVDLYLAGPGGVRAVARTGSAQPFGTRPVAVAGYVFPLTLAPGQTVLYLHAEGPVALHLPLALHEPSDLLAQASRTTWWHGLFYGLVLGLLAYNLFLWWSTRDRAFLYFVGTGITALGYFAGFDGLLYRALPEAVRFNQSLMFLAGALSITATLQFTRHFLDTPRLLGRHDRWLRGLALAALVLAPVVPFLPLAVAMALVLTGSLLMTVLMLAAAVSSWRAGAPLARTFGLVMVIHLSVLVLLGAGSLALAPGLFDVAVLVHRVSLAVILSLFSLALGERVKSAARARREAEAEVLQARADARARNEFLAKMSHELRTPMTGVLGMAELLEHTELAPQQRRYLSTLRYSGEMLLNLINDVLDHARIEAGRLQIRHEAFDLFRLVDDCRLLFEQQPRESGVPLRIELGNGVARFVVGDAQRIRQVLVNLLANAFKFTPAGTVTLRVLPMAAGWLRFEVEDTGPGIAPEDRDRLFQVFSQAPGGRAVRGGSGLGLAICRQLCELMGGRIGVHSEPGQGALFWFELPLHASE